MKQSEKLKGMAEQARLDHLKAREIARDLEAKLFKPGDDYRDLGAKEADEHRLRSAKNEEERRLQEYQDLDRRLVDSRMIEI